MFRSKSTPLSWGIQRPLILGVLASLLAIAPVAKARLGETVSECEARYGTILERVKPQSPDSDEYAIVFMKSGIRIVIEYKDGKAWKLNYEGSSTLGANFDALLRSNNDEKGWGAPTEVLRKKFWIRPDGKAHAVGVARVQKNKSKLTVVDDAFLKLRAAAYQDRLKRGDDIRAEYLNQANPLPGF